MNRRKLQKIILEELSNARHVRTQHRVLGLVDYLYESSDQNLLKIREQNDDWAVWEKPKPSAAPVANREVLPPRDDTADAPADAPAEPPPRTTAVASPGSPAPGVTINHQPTAPNEDEVDGDEEIAAAAEKARNAAAEREAEIENLRNRDSDGPGDEVTAPAPGEVPPPTLSLSDTIDDKIEKAANDAGEAPGTPVAEGTYWRRGLVDLLYSS